MNQRVELMPAKRPPENAEIAADLSKVADLLQVEEANPFRVRAYRNAAATIRTLARPLSAMVRNGEDLTVLPGIGRDLARAIRELVETGELPTLRELERNRPATLVELLRIEGLGPKRVRMLHDALGVRSVEDLARAIDEGRLAGVHGIGPKAIESMRRGIANLTARAERFRLADADQMAEPVLAWLRACPAVERAEVAGSLRRREDAAALIDILTTSSNAAAVVRHFEEYPDALRVGVAEQPAGTIVLRSGLAVDLHIATAASRAAALHFFTGSDAHVAALHRVAATHGLRMAGDGLFRTTQGHEERVPAETEEEVFRALGLPWIPPELREDRGEIEAARDGRLPRLITHEDIRGDLHMHSDWSDGKDTMETMVAACVARGLAYMAITDHSPSVGIVRGLSARDALRQAQEIERLRAAFPHIRILHGMEVDILADGTLDLPDDALARLDLVIVSAHSALRMERARMTERVIRAISHPAVRVLGHATGRLIGRREPSLIDLDAVFAAAAAHGVAVELNAQPHRLDVNDVQVRRAREHGVLISIGTDAHSTSSLDFMRGGVDQARRGWLEPSDVVNAMEPDRFNAWLARRSDVVRTQRRAQIAEGELL